MKTINIWNRLKGSPIDLELLVSLFERWQDECEYEDINEYLKKVKEVIPEAYEISELEFIIKAKGSDGEIQIHFDYDGNSCIKVFPVFRS